MTREEQILNKAIDYSDIEENFLEYEDEFGNVCDDKTFVEKAFIEGAKWAKHLQPYKEETMENKLGEITLDIPDGYEFCGISDDNKVVLTKIQPQYPKTYVECAKILDCFGAANIDGYKCELLENFQKLLICRDAYWKIAGDWKFNFDKSCYYLCNEYGRVQKFQGTIDCNAVLTFPFWEMRDAFYDNFKQLIEKCKEFL